MNKVVLITLALCVLVGCDTPWKTKTSEDLYQEKFAEQNKPIPQDDLYVARNGDYSIRCQKRQCLISDKNALIVGRADYAATSVGLWVLQVLSQHPNRDGIINVIKKQYEVQYRSSILHVYIINKDEVRNN